MPQALRWCAASTLVLAAINPSGAATGVSPGSPPSAHRPGPPTVHSSDGVRGPALTSVRGHRSAAAPADRVGWQVAPGLDYAAWTQTEVQGPVRLHVLTARIDEPGLVLDQVSGPTSVARAPLTRWLRVDHALAGVNADFFDIHDTGAPLGVGVDRQRGLLNAPRFGWNATFLVDGRGNPRVVQDRLVARIVRGRGQPPIGIHNFNSPVVRSGGIGLYTASWGLTSGKRVTEGSRQLRQVVVRNGVVQSNRTRLAARTVIRGEMLIGRGAGADRLSSLEVGQRVRVERDVTVGARMAVSGSLQLLRNGERMTRDNRELHPRTAIGIDRDHRLLHLVVADGRSRLSKGLTLAQLARVLRTLGDEDALNLDGGGSSTMVARDRGGVVGVRNRPSDGRLRYVPNGLGFRYTAPPAPPVDPPPVDPPVEPPVGPVAPTG